MCSSFLNFKNIQPNQQASLPFSPVSSSIKSNHRRSITNSTVSLDWSPKCSNRYLKWHKKRNSIYIWPGYIHNNWNEKKYNNPEIRRDAFGNEIWKGSKNHKVTFIDCISNRNVTEVYLIEKQKMYEDLNKQDTKITCSQACFVF